MKTQIILFIFLSTYITGVFLAYLLHIQLLVVTSDSMQPTFGFGDVLLAKGQEHYALQDIVSFKTDAFIATHRIVSIQNNQLIQTKGDANTSADLTVLTKEQIVGKVIAVIPKLGYAVLFAKSKYMGMFFIVALIAFLSKMTSIQLNTFRKKSYEK